MRKLKIKRGFTAILLSAFGFLAGVLFACFRVSWMFTFSKEARENRRWAKRWFREIESVDW